MKNKLFYEGIVFILYFSINIFSISELAAQGLNTGPWPNFGHDAQHTGASTHIGPNYPILYWKYKTEGCYGINSQPVIAEDGTIYARVRGNRCSNELFHAVNPDGSMKWVITDPYLESYGSPVIASNGTIYAAGRSPYYFYSISPLGSINWNTSSTYPSVSSPTIGFDGTIYTATNEGSLNALYPDGTLKWEFSIGPTIGSTGGSSPAIGYDGKIYYLAYTETGTGYSNLYLYAINSEGVSDWDTRLGIRSGSSPAIGPDGTIYVGVEVEGTSQGTGQHYLFSVDTDGNTKWQYYIGDINGCSTPVIDSEGNIYIVSNLYGTGTLYAVTKDGQTKWEYNSNDGGISQPVIDANTNLYFTSGDYLYCLDENATLKWTYYLGSTINYGPGQPIIGSGGILYVGSGDDYLYAIGIPEGKGGIYGKVTDIANDAPVTGVIVSTIAGDVQTKPDGTYDINIDPGVYDITFSKTGYQTVTIPNVAINAEEGEKIDIEMTSPGPLNVTTIVLDSAEVGVAFSCRVRISGGIYPYTYAISSGSLPAGLTIDPSNGTISGTPTTSGSTDFWVSVTDSEGAFAAQQFTITVAQPLAIDTTSPLPRATRTQPYSNSIISSGGTLPHSFTVFSGSLPSGLSLSSSGLLSGPPSVAGSYDFTIQVTDASDRTAEQSFHLDVDDPLWISTSGLYDGVVGTIFSQTLSATGGYGDYVWRVYTGQLPHGLFLDSMTGDISGTPTTAIYSNIVIEVSDEIGRRITKILSMKVADLLQLLTTSLPDAFVGFEYSEQIRISGGIGPYTFALTGLLPDGLSFDSSTGVISGIATSGMARNFSVTVQDSTYPTPQSTDPSSFFLWSKTSLTVTTSAILPNAKRDVAISPIVLSAGGGLSPYTWQLVAGYLPAGISLNPSTGELTGTPLDRGDFVFTLRATDTASTTAEKEFFWHISDTLAITTGVVADGAQNDPYSFMLEATGGIKPYTWSIVNGSLPTGLSLTPSTGAIFGTPTTRQSTEFTVRVVDADSPTQSVEHTYSMNVVDELIVFTPTLPNGRTDEAYTATVSAKLGVPPYSWRVSEGVLPPGLTFTGSDTVATLQGTPTTPGQYTFTLEVTDTGTPMGTATREYVVEIYDDVTITTEALPCAVRNQPYAENIVTTGGKIPYTYQLTAGSLPLGLSLNSTSGEISGTTAEVGGFSAEIIIRATDAGAPSDYDEQQLTIYVIDALEITTDTLQDAAVGYAYEATLEAEGGLSPHSWYLHNGALPPGLTLDSGTGVISGTAGGCGTYDFTIRVEDAAPLATVTTKAFNMSVIAIGDADCDGLSDAIENAYCTNPADADTDNDGIPDGVEDANKNGIVDTGETNPCDPDTDDDGIQDGTESGLTANDVGPDTDLAAFVPDADPATTTNPTLADSDGDGVLDGDEDLNHNGRVDAGESNPNVIEDLSDTKAMPWIPLLLLGD